MDPVRWPLVRVRAGSGRKTLFNGAQARRAIGMPLPAGRILLRDLQKHAKQPLIHVRDMRRTTVLDPISVHECDSGDRAIG